MDFSGDGDLGIQVVENFWKFFKRENFNEIIHVYLYRSGKRSNNGCKVEQKKLFFLVPIRLFYGYPSI